LKRRIAPGRDLSFAIVKAADLNEDDDAAEIGADGKLVKGSIVLTEIDAKNRFAAVARVL
jgi:hypothetical protein